MNGKVAIVRTVKLNRSW